MSVHVSTLRVSKNHFINYCYIVVNTENREASLIDPVWEPDTLERELNTLGAKPVNVFLTHAHSDHVNLVPYFIREHNCRIFITQTEADYYGFDVPNLFPITSENQLHFRGLTVKPIFTPGHTKGGVCYWIGDNLFTGDTLFTEGCGVCHVSGGSPEEMFHSLQRLKRIIPNETRIFPGHSYGKQPGQTMEHVVAKNYFMHINDLDMFIKFRMRSVTAKNFS